MSGIPGNQQKEQMALELSVLNSILTNRQSFISAASVNPPAGIFTCGENRVIYTEAMDHFLNTGNPPSMETLYESFMLKQRSPELKRHLSANVACAEYLLNTADAIKLLTEMKIEREIRNYIGNAREKGLDFATGLVEYINNNLQENLGGCMKEIRNIDTGDAVIKEVHNAMHGKSTRYISTLIPGLDKRVMGIPKGHITVVAGRPGMGKTDFMLQMLRNFMKQGLKPAVFSLEMEAEGLFLRNMSETAEIDSLRIESGDLKEEEFNMLIEASKQYCIDDYIIDDSPLETPETIKAKINYWRMRHKTDLIMIDYMTLVKTSYKEERYDLEIGALVRDLRIFAKKTGIPIIILSQLNRDTEKRMNHRPQISDLRESGSIEQEAKLVLMLYRPGEYGINPFEEKRDEYYDSHGNRLKPEEYMEIIVAKARSGRTGIVAVKYNRSIHRMEGVSTVRPRQQNA
ncbi:MAG: DnaB-like helicase C-terminal domain-containing protein [archaeon]